MLQMMKFVDQLMPVNKAFNMDVLRKGIQDYIEKTNRRVTFEYIY